MSCNKLMPMNKEIKTQDSGLKLSPCNSGESSINLSKDQYEFIKGEANADNADGDKNTSVTFTLFKVDFVKALCEIFNNLPLYTTSSDNYHTVDFSLETYNKYNNEINDFFGSSETKEYTCNLLCRKDGRIYLNKLTVEGKFSIRDFLVENISTISFSKEGNSITLRLAIDFTKKPKTSLTIVEYDKQHCTFALKCITYFSQQSDWNKIDDFCDDFDLGQSIAITNKKNIKLSGMFKYVEEDKITELNTPRRRWYLDSFKIKGKDVYLSTEWYPNSDGSHLAIPELGKFIKACYGSEYSIVRHGDQWELLQTQNVSSAIIGSQTTVIPSGKVQSNSGGKKFSISREIALIEKTGLIYSPELVKRFAFSLMSKRFLILSGLAGSGKTQLALAFANSLIEDDSQMCTVAVGADWTNREPLLGFPNALQQDEYVRPESGVLDLLIEANKKENKQKPYFLILDEMNMSYVERYFADFLSAMESDKPIKLWKPTKKEQEEQKEGEEKTHVPAEINLPDNLFIIGTINVDETTYMFSPKVLDRANVIEFKISEPDMKQFLDEMKPVERHLVDYQAADMGESFVDLANDKDLATGTDFDYKKTLNAFFTQLKSVNAEFGYRSATEIYRFISQAEKNDDTNDKMKPSKILDCAIVQKLLPKLHGSRKKLESVLQALWKECFADPKVGETTPISKDNVGSTVYQLTADKIQRMYEAAFANGFTSFAEA